MHFSIGSGNNFFMSLQCDLGMAVFERIAESKLW